MSNLRDLKEKRTQLDKEISAAEAFDKRLQGNDAHAIADLLHSRLCHYNHVDGCGYEYENWNNPTLVSRASWLTKAHKIVELCIKEGVEPGKFLQKLLPLL